jgi:hypothetical protein
MTQARVGDHARVKADLIGSDAAADPWRRSTYVPAVTGVARVVATARVRQDSSVVVVCGELVLVLVVCGELLLVVVVCGELLLVLVVCGELLLVLVVCGELLLVLVVCGELLLVLVVCGELLLVLVVCGELPPVVCEEPVGVVPGWVAVVELPLPGWPGP